MFVIVVVVVACSSSSGPDTGRGVGRAVEVGAGFGGHRLPEMFW